MYNNLVKLNENNSISYYFKTVCAAYASTFSRRWSSNDLFLLQNALGPRLRGRWNTPSCHYYCAFDKLLKKKL